MFSINLSYFGLMNYICVNNFGLLEIPLFGRNPPVLTAIDNLLVDSPLDLLRSTYDSLLQCFGIILSLRVLLFSRFPAENIGIIFLRFLVHDDMLFLF